jgi:hypothetical protein
MTRRGYSLPAVIIGVLMLLVAGCGGGPKGTEWSFGQALVLRVTDLDRVSEVQFSDGEGHYVIRPTQQDWELAALKIEVRNSESSVVFLSLDEDAMKLRGKDRTEYLPINFREQREEVPEALSDENKFAPFLWGEIELPNKCALAGQPLQNCELVGWVIFEVPKDMDPDLVLWEASDTIFLRF